VLIFDRRPRESLANPRGDLRRIPAIRPMQRDRKFLATPASDEIFFLDVSPDCLDRCFQQRIPDDVSKGCPALAGRIVQGSAPTVVDPASSAR
jgi:hypothetical protein